MNHSTPAARRLSREALILRLLWMLLFVLTWQLAAPLLLMVAVAQLLFRLVKGAPHAGLMHWGDALGRYLAQIARFAVFHTDDKPWPVADWPVKRDANGQPALDEEQAP